MPTVMCLCGKRVEAVDAAALERAFFAHTDDEHPQIKVSEARRQEIARSIRRTGGWDGRTIALDGEVEIRRLSSELKGDYFAFFDGEALADNPVWASCYCFSYQFAGSQESFDARTAAQNRTDKAALIDRGEASGVMAYAGGKVVGWCHAAPRAWLPVLDRTPEFTYQGEDAERTGAIVCFVIGPQYRGQGLARRLLDGACDMMRDRGMRWLEAYPSTNATTAASSYHGRLSMYLAAGFEHLRDAGRFAVVRKTL
ncbi:MAG: GNAT family N-acetyltransferase [Dehalococcoidia bacterium]